MDIILNILEQLNIDQSIFQQLAIVFALYLIAKFTLFNKLQEVIELRIEKTKKTEDSAQNLIQKYEVLKEEYESKVEETYKEVQTVKADEKKKIDKTLSQVYKKKEEEVSAYINEEKSKIEKDVNEQKGSVLSNADKFSNDLINKIRT